jgi:PleD family two-component response regulator
MLVAESEVRREGIVVSARVSVGGTLATSGDTLESLFARADGALYAAKESGRNRIELTQPV